MGDLTILSKNSGGDELRRYFTAILELSKQDNAFPINLDEVWMLAYSGKNKAVRALKRNFIEGEDFTTMTQNGQGGKFATIDYFLSVSCLEYFIARKVRPIFEVYRQVFHKVSKNEVRLPSAKELALMVVHAEEEKERLLLENKAKDVEIEQKEATITAQKEEIKKSAPKVDYYDDVMQSVNTLTATQVAKMVGIADGTRLNRQLVSAGICFRQSGQVLLRVPYSTWGLHSTRTQTYTRSDGSTGTSIYTVWTQKGARFIDALCKNEWNIRRAIAYIQGKISKNKINNN